MSRMSQLTKETRRDWATADRRRFGPTAETCWAHWKAEQLGIVIPKGATIRVDVSTRTAIVEHVTHIRPWTETLRGPRGGFKGYVHHGDRYARDTVATFPVPAHALNAKHADRWHAAHQAGASLDDCYTAGMGWAHWEPRKEAA
jgi:hypothetical protein